MNPENFFFIQIGANDGKTHDPIYSYVTKYNLRGIAVELNPEVFVLLKETYAKYPNVQCVNVAIAKESGILPVFMAKESVKTKENYSLVTGITTLKKDVLRHTLSKRIPKEVLVDDFIEEVSITAITLDQLLKNNGVTRIDMIQLDCEGYDYEILKMIDFNKFSPCIINFESNHISDADREDCQKMLEAQGYKWFRHGIDTCAYKV